MRAPYSQRPELENINYTLEKPISNFLYLLFGAFIISALVLLLLGFTGEFVVRKMPVSWEKRIFSSFSGQMSDKKEFVEAQALLKKIVGDKATDYAVKISCEDFPNAFAFPGNTILITSNLIKGLKSENGLAFVLAHEYGHFLNKHHLSGLGFGIGMLIGASVIGVDEFGSAFFRLTDRIISRQFSQSQEISADFTAKELLIKTYGHTNGAAEFFDYVNALAPDAIGDSLFSTHPTSEERIELVKKGYKTNENIIPYEWSKIVNSYCPEFS